MQTLLVLLAIVSGFAATRIIHNHIGDAAITAKFAVAFGIAAWAALRQHHRWAARALLAVTVGAGLFEVAHQPNLAAQLLCTACVAFVLIVEWNS